MPECELCGRKSLLVTARIDGVLLKVCSDCAQKGKIVDLPKPKLHVPVQSTKTAPEEIVVSDFAQKIRQARQQKELKQEELANAVNEKLSIISAVESGKRTPDLKLAKKFEKFFGISLIEVE